MKLVGERSLYDVAKLLDFGLVKPLTEIGSARLTKDGAISGTPLFMSPEQARGSDEVDSRSDIYSLGTVAYTLLSGRPPFERTTPMEVIIAHARDEVVPSFSRTCPPISNALFSAVWPRSRGTASRTPTVWNRPYPSAPPPTGGRRPTPPTGGGRTSRCQRRRRI